MVEEGIWRERRRKFHSNLSAPDGAHPTVNSSRLMARLMTGLKVGAPNAHSIVFIDDATSALMALRSAPAETTWLIWKPPGYLNDHGVPLASILTDTVYSE